ncbi:MAG: RidA family protein [Alphaproteobacteria bacterium]|nr:MAG: RidA family protein [Alphaproteobacteria bacterium]
MSIEKKLADMGIILPTVTMPAANYVPFTISGSHIFVSGTLPSKDGVMTGKGTLGANISLEEAQDVARTCGINILAVLKAAAGSLDTITRCVRLGIFVSATPDYTDHPKVANGVSDLMVEVFGKEIGSHARFAVGVSSLPFGVSVEVDGVFEFSHA